MKILLDMNLSPAWVDFFSSHKIESTHWYQVGSPESPDTEIIDWARENDYVVFTHDLDYGAILYSTKAKSPSVIQIRIEDIRPNSIGNLVVNAIHQAEEQIKQGALLTIDLRKNRIHLLPLSKQS